MLLASASQRCHVVQLPPRSRLDEEWRLCRSVCRQINERCHVTARSRRTSSCRRIISLYTIEYVSAPQCCSTGFLFAFSIHKTCHARAGVRAGVVFDCTTHAQRPRAPGQLSFTQGQLRYVKSLFLESGAFHLRISKTRNFPHRKRRWLNDRSFHRPLLRHHVPQMAQPGVLNHGTHR